MESILIAVIALLGYLIFSAVWWGLTWLVYMTNMCILHAGVETAPAKVIPTIAVFMSTSLNWLVFTIILLEWPRERLLSTRLARHKRRGDGWRQRVAKSLGSVWLDPYDPKGYHI